MKRFLLIVAVITLVGGVFFAAGAKEAKAEETKVLRVWDIYPEGTPFRGVLDGAIGRFKANYPDYEVEIISYGDMSNYKTKFATMMAAGAKDADVFQTWGGGQLAMYADKGLVMD